MSPALSRELRTGDIHLRIFGMRQTMYSQGCCYHELMFSSTVEARMKGKGFRQNDVRCEGADVNVKQSVLSLV